MTNIIDAQQRQQAILPDGSYLVQAPAGSGKTELLIQRILALLAIVEQPEEILALTFTRKAAAEMRERVLLALQQAQQPLPEQSHAQTTWHLAQAALKQSEARDWRLTLYPAQLRIMTIDAFASGLARQLPILSGFGQTPTTADFSDTLYQSAVDDLIQYAHQRHAPELLKQAVNTLILHLDCNIAKLSNLLCAMLGKREQWLEDVLTHSMDMQAFRAHLENCLESVIEHAQYELHEALPVELKGRLPQLASLAEQQLSTTQGSDNMLAAVAGITAFPDTGIAHMPQWKALVQLLLVKDKEQARKSVTVREGFPAGKAFKDAKDAMKELLAMIADDAPLLAQLHRLRFLPDNASFHDDSWAVLEALFITLKTLAAQLWTTFERHKKVDFIEVMLRAKQALGNWDRQGNLIPSEALLRLDCQIKHILVDEFQDTSTLQIDLLSRLTAGWDNDGRTLFMVGDPMQSIYRFRQAEVRLFLRAARNELPEQQKLPLVTSLTLSQNFRSSPDIVHWVNRAFSRIFPENDDLFEGAISYTPSQAFKGDPGAVRLNILKQRNDSFEAEQVVELVQAAEGKRVGILARNRSHLHSIMLLLQSRGIPFRALDMLPLNKQPEIIELRTLTSALLHPADHVAWAGLLRSPAIGLSLPSLHEIYSAQPISSWAALQSFVQTSQHQDDRERARQCIQRLEPVLKQVGRLPLRKLVESAWLQLRVASMLSQSQLANCESFFELLEYMESEGPVEISLLDQRLENLFAKPEVHPQASQVELLTMHGAKGLQWDMVILPGLGKTPRARDKEVLAQTEANTHDGPQLLLAPLPHSSKQNQGAAYNLIRDFEKQRDALEVARLLYVACTRAEYELHLFGHLSESSEEPASASLLRLLWQDMDSCYGAQLVVHDQPATDDNEPVRQAVQHRHITMDYIPPEPHPAIPGKRPDTQGVVLQPEFSWAGATAKAVGIALHAGLQFLSEQQQRTASNMQVEQQAIALMHRTLIREGISQKHINNAMQRCRQGLKTCMESERAQWILSAEHRDAHNEWALTYVDGDQCRHIILDRTFIDAEGTRWVIDYKTGDHQGAGLDAFLDQELIRYTRETPQLPNYVRALKSLEPDRKVKAALYFPMMDGWRVWNDE